MINISNEIKQLIVSLRKEYQQIEETIFISVVKRSINRINDLNVDSKDRLLLYKREIEKSLNDIISKNRSLDNIINRINFFDTYEANIIELYKISSLIDIDDLEKLLELPSINKLVANIVNHDYDKIKITSIRNIYKNDILSSLIEMYCTINNIVIYTDNNKLEDNTIYKIDSIKKYPSLTREQEIEYLDKIHNNRDAYNYFFMCNFGLVVSVASRYINKGVDYNDIIQEGSIGLMKAIEKFDVTKGVRFSTYAVYWIKQTIRRAYSNKSRSIRLPDYIVDLLDRMRFILGEWTLKYNREPKDCEYANELGIPVDKVVELKKIYYDYNQLRSLDDYILEEDSDSTLVDFVEDKSINIQTDYEQKQFQKDILYCMSTVLNEKEQDVLKKRFGFYCEERTLESIGLEYGVTRERIRQIESHALKKIRNSKYRDSLKIYLDFDKTKTKK